MLRVRSRIEMIGVNPYVLLDEEQVNEIKKGWRGPMPVRFRIVGAESDALWRVNLMPVRDGTFRLYLNGEIRRATGLDTGDTVTVDLLFDEEYRGGPMHQMPPWFGDELERNPAALGGWALLSPSRQKEILRYFARLKSAEAKGRNLQKAIQVLGGGVVGSWDGHGNDPLRKQRARPRGPEVDGVPDSSQIAFRKVSGAGIGSRWTE